MGTTSVNAPDMGDPRDGAAGSNPSDVTDPADTSTEAENPQGDGPRHPVRGPLLGARENIEHFSRRVTVAIGVVVGLILVFSLVLRLWTTSDLWLDEALTVNISRLPLSQLHEALKQDGACTDRDLRDHCRWPIPHVRGCWVVDLVLGNS